MSADLVGTMLPGRVSSWTVSDCLLYALGVGASSEDSTTELNLTTEDSEGVKLQTIPTMAIALSAAGVAAFEAVVGPDTYSVLFSERIELNRPIPTSGKVHNSYSVAAIEPDRHGQVVEIQGVARLDGCGTPLYRLWSSSLIRATPFEPQGATRRPQLPTETPDEPTDTVRFRVPPNQALIYRWIAEPEENRYPFHSDPVMARRFGFDGPILHGRCTLGFVARLLIARLCGGNAEALTSIGARFTSAVRPGDELALEVWEERGGGRFRVVKTQDCSIVLSRGTYTVAPSPASLI